jgi:hypothetical protein
MDTITLIFDSPHLTRAGGCGFRTNYADKDALSSDT